MDDPNAIREGLTWIVAGPLMAFGAYIGFFSWFRHWEMRRQRLAGTRQNISGTPFVGSVFFFLGWWISPLSFTPWLLLYLPAELGNFVGFESAEVAEAGEPEEGEDGEEVPGGEHG